MQTSQKIVLPTMPEQERVYCQVVNLNITGLNCMQTQGLPACFACAAPSRVCEQCKKRPIAVSVAGICGVCLTQALCEERKKQKPIYQFGDRVYCQMVSKEINTSTCLNMQGAPKCRDCPAHSRTCEQCHNRPVAIPRTGFCLHCIVQEYGEGWKPMSQNQLDDALQESKNETLSEGAHASISQEIKTTDLNPAQKDRKTMIGKDRETDHQESVPPKQIKKQAKSDPELIRQARELVMKHEYASAIFLQTHLKVSYYQAQQLLDSLENERTVGPPEWTKARRVYLNAESHMNSSQPHAVSPEMYTPPKRTFTHMMSDVRTFILTTGETRIRIIREHLHMSGKHIPAIMQALEHEGILGTTKRGRGNTRPVLVPILSSTSDLSDPSHISGSPDPMNNKNPRTVRIQRIKDLAVIMGEQSKFVREVLMPTVDDLSMLESITQTLEQTTLDLCGIFEKINVK